MRLSFVSLAVICAAGAIPTVADTITSGHIYNGDPQTQVFDLGFSTQTLTFIGSDSQQQFNPPPQGPCPAGVVCDVSFSISIGPQVFQFFDASTRITYNGTTYYPGLYPNVSFTLAISITAAPFTEPACFTTCGFSSVPFTLTGSASLTSLGQSIFSGLPLSGSGFASGSHLINFPSIGDSREYVAYIFRGPDTSPEPSSFFLGATGGLAVLLWRSKKKRSSSH